MTYEAPVVPHSTVFPFMRGHQLNRDLQTDFTDEDKDSEGIARKGPGAPLGYPPGHPRVNIGDTTVLFQPLVRESYIPDIELVADRL